MRSLFEIVFKFKNAQFKILKSFSFCILFVLISASSYATSNQAFVYQGRIVRPDGTAINSGSVIFTLSVYSPSPSHCLLYSETQTVDMSGSLGNFSLALGTGTRTDSGAHTFNQAFINGSTLSSLPCASGTSYTAAATDDRSLSVTFNDAGTVVNLSAMKIKSVPFALQAHEIDGWGLGNLVKVSALGSPTTFTIAEMANAKAITGASCASGEVLKWSGATWACAADITTGASTDAGYTSSNKGIVAFDTDAATSGMTVTAGLAAVNTGTTANKIVKLDASAKLPGVDGSALTNLDPTHLSAAMPINKGGTGQITAILGFNALSPLTTKGDLITSDGTNNVRLPAGTNGYVLTADSAQTSGVKWAPITAGTVTSVSSANADIGVANGTSTPVLTLNSGTGNNQIVKLDGSAKLPAVDGSALTNLNAGNIASGTLPVTRGGTGGTTFGNNGVVVSNGTGSALQSLNCTSGQVITFDVSGYAVCGAGGANGFVNGGNSFGSNATLGTNDNYALSIKTNNATAMTILPSGSVGIGTTSPAGIMDVNIPSGGNIYLGNAAASTVQMTNGRIVSASSLFQISGRTYGSLEVPVTFLTSSTERMRIDTSGNVGIGTIAPGEKFEVNGAIKIGTTAGANAGTIRWDGTSFQGYTGTSWVNLSGSAAPGTTNCDTTQTFSTAGTYTYNVPASFGSITIKIWGAGGGGGGANGAGNASSGTNGGSSSISSLGLFAAGGTGGGLASTGSGVTSGAGGLGGAASGGTVNSNGTAGETGPGGRGGNGGSSSNGGSGGVGTNGSSIPGASPGGGGAGGQVASYSAGGGGGGAYVEKTFTSASLNPGTSINDIIVGAGGSGGGAYGGNGGIGRVSIACTSTGTPPANDRAILFMNSGAYSNTSNFVYSAAGNVGINTSSPVAKLEIVGSSGSTLKIVDGNQGLGKVLTSDANGMASWATPSVGGSGTVTSVSSANSDISVANGTSTPVLALNSGTGNNQIVKLDGSARLPAVDGSALTNLNAGNISSGTLPINRGGTAATSFAANAVIVSNGTGSALQALNCTSGQVITFDASGYAICGAAGSAGFVNGGNSFSAAAILGTNDNNPLYIRTNNNSRMTILSSGNVGVGTSNPGATFHVNGAAAFENSTNTSAGPTFSFWKTRNYTAVQNNDELGYISFYGHGGTGVNRSAYIASYADATPTVTSTPGRLAFYTTPAGDSDSTERMRIDSNGKVGIGTTSPGQKLTVAGTIESTSGGIKFPDGTVQTTAASGGTATGVIHYGMTSPSGVKLVQASASAGLSAAFSGAVTAGNLLVVALQAEGSVSPISVTDTIGTTYTKAAEITGMTLNMAVYYGIAPSSGANTVTGTQASSFARTSVSEFQGAQAVVDATASVYNSNPLATVNITTLTAGDLLYAAAAGFHSANNFSAGTGFTLATQGNGSDANAVEYKTAGAPAVYTATINVLSAGTDNSPFIVVAFKQTASGSTVGNDGDFYLDLSTRTLYGPRSGGVYAPVGTLN